MKKIILSFSFVCGVAFCEAQSGELDPSFGNAGIVNTDMGVRYNYNTVTRQVLMQADGSMYVIGNYPTFIFKRLPDGKIDTSYGNNGYSRAVSFNQVSAAFQPDGKIVIVGQGYPSAGMARINTNGTIDSTFGQYGIVYTSFFPTSVAVKADGKIVVTEAGSTGYVVNQFNTNGSIDNGFHANGQTSIDFIYKLPPPRGNTDSIEAITGTATAIAVQTDGKILVSGYVETTDIGTNFAIARFNSSGSIDSAFGNNGKQTSFFPEGTAFSYSLALQTDGKILLAGYTHQTGNTNYLAIVRYNVNGSPDSSFNGNGKQTANAGAIFSMTGYAIGIQSDNKILVGGYLDNGSGHDFAVARFNSNGSTDNSFGNSGFVITDINTGDDFVGSVSVQTDNKIVLAGHTDSATSQHIAITRYNANGTLDVSFGNGGILIEDYKQGFTQYNASIIQPDGKILAAGATWNGVDNDFAIARYNTDGTLDKTFGDGGKQITDLGKTDEALSIALQPDGKIVLGGNSYNNSSNDIPQIAAVRYNTYGSLDNTFDGDGKLLLSPIGYKDWCTAIAMQKDGKIVIAGYSNTINGPFNFALARLNNNGTPDNTFSGDGKQVTEFGLAESSASAIAIQDDGKIVLGGRSFLNNQNSFCLARYNIDGNLDATFSNDGKQITAFGTDGYFGSAMALQKDGKIVMAGYSEIIAGSGKPFSTSFVVARYNTDGALDNTFNHTGYQSAFTGPGFNFATSVAIRDDGRIAVAGSNDNFAIALFKSDGSPDSTFGHDGIKISSVAVYTSRIQSVAFDFNRLYAVGYGKYPGYLGVVVRYSLSEGGPLPVTLLDFKGSLQNNNTVLLQWQTVNEYNLSGFTVQRSNNGGDFNTIGYVAAKHNNNSKTDYTTVDNHPLQGVNYYRLQMIDQDGQFTYSKTVAIIIQQEIFSLQVAPNPAKNILVIRVKGVAENGVFQITDATGRKVKEGTIAFNNNSVYTIDINALPKGIYNLQVATNTKIETRRFVKE
jgi:uncharacterized delta-60 repeat protein